MISVSKKATWEAKPVQKLYATSIQWYWCGSGTRDQSLIIGLELLTLTLYLKERESITILFLFLLSSFLPPHNLSKTQNLS